MLTETRNDQICSKLCNGGGESYPTIISEASYQYHQPSARILKVCRYNQLCRKTALMKNMDVTTFGLIHSTNLVVIL